MTCQGIILGLGVFSLYRDILESNGQSFYYFF